MTVPQLLNAAGLIAGMLGVVIIFVWGPPQPSFDTGVSIGLGEANVLKDGRTVAEYNAELERQRARHAAMSKAGLVLVFIGFALQLWATFA